MKAKKWATVYMWFYYIASNYVRLEQPELFLTAAAADRFPILSGLL